MSKITRKWYHMFKRFLAVIKWEELFHGFLMIWLGWQYSKYYGYKIQILSLINVVLWFLNFKTALFILAGIASEEIKKIIYGEPYLQTLNQRFRTSFVNFFWIITAIFLITSIFSLYQIYDQFNINILSMLLILAMILVDLVIIYNERRLFIPGIQEISAAFLQSFVLPAIVFVLITGHIHFSLLSIAFPLFLMNISFKINNQMELIMSGKQIAPSMLTFHLSIQEASLLVALLILSSPIILVLQINLRSIHIFCIFLILALITAFFILRRRKNPNLYCPWCKLLILTQYLLLIFATPITLKMI